MYRHSIVKVTLASLLFSATAHSMQSFKQLSIGAGAVASLGLLAYAYAKSIAQPAIKMKPEHTPGIEGKMNPFLRFTLYKTSDKSRVGSICAGYCTSTHTAHIPTINIAKEYQDHGYGTQLWDTMIDELTKQDIHMVTWKAIPTDLPRSATAQEQEKAFKKLVAWYMKRTKGRAIIEKQDAHEVHMKLPLKQLSS